MRGDDTQQSTMFSYLSPEKRVPASHPLRPIRLLLDRVLLRLNTRFEQMYATTGRPSIAPEKLLRALMLQILYSVRSERMLMEQLAYNLLFRWFVGLNMDEEVWVPTVFSKNRDRLLAGDVAEAFFRRGAGRSERLGPALGRTLHRGRNAAGGVGGLEEFSAQGWRRTRTERYGPWQSDRGFSRREAQQ